MNMPFAHAPRFTYQSEREQMLEMLLSALDGMVYRCRFDAHWTMEFVSQGCFKLTGYHPHDLIGNSRISYEAITHPEDRAMVRERIDAAIRDRTHFSIEYRIVHADGSIRRVLERGTALAQESQSLFGQPLLLHGFIEDITLRHEHERELRDAEFRYRSIFENANKGIFQTTPDGHYLRVNPALAAIYGYDTPQELCTALTDIELQLYVDPGRRTQFKTLMLEHEVVNNFESQVYTRDRRIIWIAENAHVVRDVDGNVLYYEGTVEDITQRKQYEQQIAWQATHDVLTGLPNRALLAERIAMATRDVARHGGGFAVAFIDIDHFKNINDTLGHSMGDLLIKQVADRLQQTVRDLDTVARIGGDEFVLLLRHVGDNPADIRQLAERVIAVVRQPCALGDKQYSLSCSMGISLHPADGNDADTLLKNADIAMYQAKESGRNNCQFYTPEYNQLVVRNHHLEQQLRAAVQAQAFELHFQPIVDARTGRLMKAEALLRWPQADGGFVSPERFIPVAENSGLIEPIGNWVLDAVCRQLSEWQQGRLAGIPVTINISPRQFNQQGLAGNIHWALSRHGLDPSLLELEITENCMIRDKGRFMETLAELKASGLKVAIDDFGSGYSNLDSLRSMHFHALKIDRSFITGIEREYNQCAICRALISMAHNLNLLVVAEGVETQAQVDFLVRSGCDMIQGYHYSRPLTPPQFVAYVQAMSAQTG